MECLVCGNCVCFVNSIFSQSSGSCVYNHKEGLIAGCEPACGGFRNKFMVFAWIGWEIKDEWFLRCHLKDMTKPFCKWWIRFYGNIDQYADIQNEEDKHEYYIRMAFALMGWNARELAKENTKKG